MNTTNSTRTAEKNTEACSHTARHAGGTVTIPGHRALWRGTRNRPAARQLPEARTDPSEPSQRGGRHFDAYAIGSATQALLAQRAASSPRAPILL